MINDESYKFNRYPMFMLIFLKFLLVYLLTTNVVIVFECRILLKKKKNWLCLGIVKHVLYNFKTTCQNHKI